MIRAMQNNPHLKGAKQVKLCDEVPTGTDDMNMNEDDTGSCTEADNC